MIRTELPENLKFYVNDISGYCQSIQCKNTDTMYAIKRLVGDKFKKEQGTFRLCLSGIELGVKKTVVDRKAILNTETFKDLNKKFPNIPKKYSSQYKNNIHLVEKVSEATLEFRKKNLI